MKNLRILAIAALLVASVSGCSVLYPNWGKPTDKPSPTATDTTTPTPEPTDTKTPTPDPSKEPASVEIMDAYVDVQGGVLSVVAQVTNFSEDGGTCTATFSGGGKSSSVTMGAESNAANTQCRVLEIPLGVLAKGKGTVIVKYDSAVHSGVSAETSVTIP